MSIITKKIGKGKYAYLTYREGRKVIQKYLGPLDSPAVNDKIAEFKEVQTVPERFRALFWDTDLANISLKRHARYVIERVLEFGNIDAITWLQKVYNTRVIIDAMNESLNINNKSRNFWEIWFGSGKIG